MRRRVNLRDIFWYRDAVSTGGRVLDARPIFQVKSPMEPKPPPRTPGDGIARQAQVSALDSWQRRFRGMFSASSVMEDGSARRKWFGFPMWSGTDSRRGSDQEKLAGSGFDATGTTETTKEGRRIKSKYKMWGLLPRSKNDSSAQTNDSSLNTRDRFLTVDSGDPSRSERSQDVALTDMLAHPTAHEGKTGP